ncbi:MAG: hypothetical protein ACRDDI_17165, partial [Aeromonas veronii]
PARGLAMYHALITALYTQLGLPLPVAGQTATTLTINDELVLTLAEDEGHLVIYLLLPGHAMPNTPLLNHLGDEPVFLLDQTEQGETLIWAREWLDHLTVDSLLLLLERAIELAAELLTHQHDREQSTQPQHPASTTATIRV